MPERQYHGQPNGRVMASRERGGAVPGTPSRKDKGRESLAVQDPGLKDYVGFPLDVLGRLERPSDGGLGWMLTCG